MYNIHKHLHNSPVEIFWTYEFSKVQGFLVDLASHGVPEEIYSGCPHDNLGQKYLYAN